MHIGVTCRSSPVARKKTARSYRLSDDTIRRLDELAEWLGTTETAVVERAVLELHRKEAKQQPPRKSAD
jgi:predicted transcriptional regulator